MIRFKLTYSQLEALEMALIDECASYQHPDEHGKLLQEHLFDLALLFEARRVALIQNYRGKFNPDGSISVPDPRRQFRFKFTALQCLAFQQIWEHEPIETNQAGAVILYILDLINKLRAQAKLLQQ